MIQDKNKAATEEKYRELSKQFRKMGSYENSAQLADECDRQADERVKVKEREKKARYDEMVKEISSASSENKYRQLANEFREMGNYENAVQLADECDKQTRIFEKKREEQEQQEKARIAAQEAAKQAERERQNRYEEEQKRRKKLVKRIRGFMFTFVPVIVGFLLYYIAGKEILNSLSFGSILFDILVGLVMVISIARIHFSDYGFISIAIFGFCLLLFTVALWEQHPWGSLAMVVAFIMALKYPKEKYWD